MFKCKFILLWIIGLTGSLMLVAGAHAAPAISSLSPTSGAIGASVTITGTGFGSTQGTSTLKFNGKTATPTSWSDTSIVAPVPATTTTGNVVATVSSVASNGVSFTVLATPTITSLTPSSAAIGASITIAGTNFGASQGVSTVAFNGTMATPTSWSATSIAVPMPSGATSGNVVVHASGIDTNAKAFTVLATPSISGLSPTSGAAGTSVTISGSNFGATRGTSTVQFNGTASTPTSWSAASIAVPVPTGATTGNVVVHASGVDTNGSSFTVLPTPTITNLSPTSARAGTSVTITGTNFGATQGSSTVTFNGTAGTPTSWGATSIVVPVPSGASSGNVVVTVSGVVSSGAAFSIVTVPLGWSDGDIGSVGLAGSASYANGVFTVKGAGAGVNNSADAYHFVYQALSGDGSISARVVSAMGASPQVGVMIRETLDPASANDFVNDQNQTGIRSVYLSDRASTAGGENVLASVAATLPYWIKVVRSSSTFAGYTSSDGVNWVPLGSSQSISMASTVYLGLGVTSQDVTSLTTATFDNVSFGSTVTPAPVISSVSATTGPVGSQVVISGTGFGATQGSSQVLLASVPVTISGWSATSITITIPSGAVTGPLVVSVAPGMDDSNPIVFTVTTKPLPAGWLDRDVGSVGLAGSATYLNGVFTVKAAGLGLANDADGFHFVYQPLDGDGTLVARVASATGSLAAQAGVLIRETLDANATNMFMAAGTISGSIQLLGYDRLTTGAGEGILTGGYSAPLPTWLKVVRSGFVFSVYTSLDGVNWTEMGLQQPISMAQIVYVGLGVNSGDPATLATATFDNISLSSSTATHPVITSLSATTGAVGSQVVVSGNGFGSTQGSSTVSINNVTATVTSWSSGSITVTVPTGATSGPLVVNLAPSMNASNPVTFTVTTGALPIGWLDQDIGAVGVAGNASYSAGVFTIRGAGYGVGTTADAFHFVYQPLSSNGTIVARVKTQGTGTQAGIMIRPTFDPSSTNVFTYLYSYGAGNGYSYVGSRTIIGLGENAVGGTAAVPPYWVKAVRTADSFTCYISANGSTWTQIGSPQTFPTAQTVYVGLGVDSGSITASGTATFDNVTITAGSSIPNPVVTGVAPTSGAPGTTVTITGQGFGATQSSSSVLFNSATATISSWSDTSIVAVVPPGASTGPVGVEVANITARGPTFNVSLMVQVSDSLGNQSSYTSQPAGGQWDLISAQGSGCSSCTTRGTVNKQFDVNGNVLWRSDALGFATSYQYDSQNNVLFSSQQIGGTTATASYSYNSFGQVTSLTDAASSQTANTYDSKGNLTSVTSPSSAVTQFTYDSKGELTTITDPLNNVTTLTYTSVGLIATITDAQSHVTTYQYDAHGNRTSVTDPMMQQTTFAYDAGDRLTTITYPGGTTTVFTYDTRGRRTSVTDQNSKTSTYAYDDADRLTSVTDPANNVTTYAYDTENNLTGITDANSHTTNFSYDAYGRVTRTTFPSSLTELYTYDANNDLTSKTDRKGQTINYVYDALNQLASKRYPDGTEVDYVYDLVGKIQNVNDPSGTYAFAYDTSGRLIGTTTSYSFLSARNFTSSYGYDAASNRASFTDPESDTTSYAYDTLNRLTTMTPPAAFTATGSFGFAYDALSRRTSLTRPNSVNTTYTYDNLSRLLGAVHKLGATALDGSTYTVDNAGNRSTKADQLTGVTSNYTYDALYELTQTAQGGSATESYTYDPVGNRLSSLGSPFTVNSSNELTGKTGVGYTYDANGNTITKTDTTGTTAYAWDYENRLTSVTLPGTGGTVSFKYDPFGRRIYKSSSSATSIYAYDGPNLVEETNSSGAVVARYTDGTNVDEPLAMLRSSTTSYYHADGLGSVTSLSNTAGTLAQTYTFDSFGKQTASTGSLINPFQYTGRESDPETSLYYYRARYYDPAVGRFVSEDPIGFSGGSNFYRYARNNPVRRKDPSGLCPIFVGYRPEVTLLPTVGPPIQLVHTFIVIGCGKDRNVLESEPTETPFPWNKPKVHAQTYPLIPGLDPSNPVWTDPEIFVGDDGRPCSSDLKTFNDFANAVNNASVPYHLLGPNSNSVTSGGLSALGINDWSPPVIAPGWGSPLTHK